MSKQKTYFVAYDLKEKDPEDYQELYKEFEKFSNKRIQKSVYIISSLKSAQELCNQFKKNLQADDKIIIIEISENIAYNYKL